MGAVLSGLWLGLTALVWLAALWAGLGGALPWPVVAVLSVLPYVAVALILGSFLLWTLLPDRPVLPLALTLALVAPLLHWGPGWRGAPATPASAAAPTTPVTVLTWNARRLWGGPSARARDARGCLVGAIQAAAPDVVLLQELTRAELDVVAGDLGLSCAWDTYRAGEPDTASGIAVCARSGWQVGAAAAHPYLATDDWQYVRAELLPPGGAPPLVVYGVHLATLGVLDQPVDRLDDVLQRLPRVFAAQAAQADALLAAVQRDAGATLLIGGDFNGTRDTPVHGRLRTVLQDAWESRGDGFGGTVDLLGWLPLRIDHVYVGAGVGVDAAAVPQVGCSDHRPVVVTLHR